MADPMTAHQQLASMLEYLTDTGYAPATAGDFIRDHGPALVELIEAAQKIAGDYGGVDELLCNINRLDLILPKLTEPT